MQEQLNNIEAIVHLASLVELAIAFVLALPIGWDRERETRSIGLRTFPLVSLASWLKDGGNVHGTATAASIWNTGAVGAAVAFHRYEVAVALSLVNFSTLRFFPPLKKKLL